MVEDRGHPLREWRLSRGFTLDAAAAGVGTFRGTWYDWESGRRIPDRKYMPRVFRFTAGAVTPNDFYDLPDLDGPELPLQPTEPLPLLAAVEAVDREPERQAA